MADIEKTAQKQRGRPFQKGQSGNPKGRPQGSRHKATIIAQALLDGQTESLVQKAVELALAGDVTALRLCIERLVPPRKDSPVVVTLPEMGSDEVLDLTSLTVEEFERLTPPTAM